MNITDRVAKSIGGEIKKLIENNKEIQFYYNDNISKYQWIDSRYEDTNYIWHNPTGKSRAEVIRIFKNHLETKEL